MKKALQAWEEELQDSLDQKAHQETWVNTDVLETGCIAAEVNGLHGQQSYQRQFLKPQRWLEV